MIVKLNLYG